MGVATKVQQWMKAIDCKIKVEGGGGGCLGVVIRCGVRGVLCWRLVGDVLGASD